MTETSIYIPSVDAKDIYLSSHYIKDRDNAESGYTLLLKDGKYNLKRFKNTLDYSLDLIELYKIYYKKYRRRNFSFKVNGHEYSTRVINLTFKYSVKEWNQMCKNTYVKFGYDYKDLVFNDCIALNNNGDVIGIKLHETVKTENECLPHYFFAEEVEDNDGIHIEYSSKLNFKTLMTNSELRELIYKNGFYCDGVKYCRMKRSSGSARVGKCLFIDENLYKGIFNFSCKGLKIKEGQEVDLAAFESYISLPSSSIIGTIELRPENILLIDDYESVFYEDVIATRDIDGTLSTSEENAKISNSIWDGQSLIDISAMGKYSEHGMVLLRNLMFKSCCFNCNIQQWFQDNNITDISQLNGKTRATCIEDIKLITTPNSIKYLKFSDWNTWLDNVYPIFGVVKYDKPTHYFGGRLVQTHYQLLNTLQLSLDDTRELLKESLDFAQDLRNKPEIVRFFIKYPDISEFNPLEQPMISNSDVVYNMLSINDKFAETKYYRDFLIDLLRSFYKNLKNGHIYVNGNYSTLLGNPIEMLQQAIGIFDGTSQIGVGNIHSTRFEYNKIILGSRSPHVTIGNILLCNNVVNDDIDKYCNLTEQIVCINSIGENILERLSGADFDSDTMMLTDNQILIQAAQKNYNIFKTPTNLVSGKKVKRHYTSEEKADLDIKTSVNLIGEIINLSQELNSLLWDKMYKGASYKDVEDLYFDICQLDVMSNIEIDKAKKEFTVDNSVELNKLRMKYKDELTEIIETDEGDISKKIMPHFFAHVARQKGYYNPNKKKYTKYNTTMDYVQTVVNGFRIKNSYKKHYIPFVNILNNNNVFTSHINKKQINKMYSLICKYIDDRQVLIMKTSLSYEDRYTQSIKLFQDLINEINSEVIGYSTMYTLLSSIEKPENKRIKNVLIKILFLCGNESFNKIIKSSCEEINVIDYCDVSESNMSHYNIPLKITKNSLNSQIDT